MAVRDNIAANVSIVSTGAGPSRRRLFAGAAWGFAIPLVLRHVGQWLRRRHQVKRSRRALERLTASELRDIGLTRNEALAEYRKSFSFD